ncbi:hypothetical protein JCM3765_007480 [Sporobolomyces pararoseus]
MQGEQAAGERGQQQRRNDQQQGFPNLASNSNPPHHQQFQSTSIQLPQTFVPYTAFLNDNNGPSSLPTPPPPQHPSNGNSYSFSPPADTPSSAYSLGHSHAHNELSPLMTNMFGAALTSPNLGGNNLSAAATSSNFLPGTSVETSTDSPQQQQQQAAQNKIVQKADRSCKKCRERRVRCDRQYPACARCTKRREQCSYGTGVFVETVEEGSDAAKIAELESKVASLESQLKNASNQNNNSNSNSRINNNPPRTLSHSPTQPSLTSLARESLAAVVAHAVTSGLSIDERNVLDQLLNEQDQSSAQGNAHDQRGGGGASRKDIGITHFLLDASTRACCTKLPGLHLLRDRLPYFKANLNSLDPPHRLAAVCMCAIGVRVFPNPALFGTQSVTQSDGTPIPHLFRSVGVKREKICQALCKVAMEGCWEMGILREQSYENLDALVGFVQYLIHEEGRPEDARFFVRELVGMYLDIRHEELSSGIPTKLNEANTTAVFLADGAVSSTCHKPSFITPIDLQDYFATGGLRVPDLVNMQLGEIIEEQLGIPLNRPGILNMLTSLCLYVFSCHRVFSQVSNPRRPSGSSILPFIRNLWSVLDQIHQAVQRLQQHLVNLSSAPSGFVDDPQAIDHAILLAVRADNSLVDLIMLIHVHLREKYSDSAFWPERDGDEELERMRSESSMRVFKCLKLLAFYCQLYLASQDKHNVFHLILRLELLPNWTSLAAARIGSPGGPISEEFEASQEELDWFRCALELACYYSPKASARLAALQNARQTSSAYSAPSPAPTLRVYEQPQHHLTSSSLSNVGQLHSAPSPHSHQNPNQTQQLQSHYVDTPLTTASSHYTPNLKSNPTSPSAVTTSSASTSFLPSASNSLPCYPSSTSHIPPPGNEHNEQKPSNVFGEDFAMHGVCQSFQSSSPNSTFADGAGVDVTGGSTDAVKNAFRSLDWVDLSLTPVCQGSNSDGSSADGGNGGDAYKLSRNG